MAEYIDKDKLLDDIECIDISDCTDIDDIFREVKRTIDEQPTADVVGVVMCKNCKHGRNIDKNKSPEKYFREGCIVCTHVVGEESMIYLPTHFCSYGARMDGDTE